MRLNYLVVLVVLGLILSGCASSPKEGAVINQIGSLETEYVLDLDRFLEEYSLAFEHSYDTEVKINDGLAKFSELVSKKTTLKSTTDQIITLAEQGSSGSGDSFEKEYFESIHKCYLERNKVLDNSGRVIENYQKSLRYSLYALAMKESYAILLTQADNYAVFVENEDVENSIKTLTTIQSRVKDIKDATLAAKGEIKLGYQDKLVRWAEQYGEIIDLSKQGWQKTGSERERLFTLVNEKAAKMGESLSSTEVEEQEKNWHYENIEKLDSASSLAFNEANRQCDQAVKKYEELFT